MCKRIAAEGLQPKVLRNEECLATGTKRKQNEINDATPNVLAIFVSRSSEDPELRESLSPKSENAT
jgi:hypothetical protein